MLDTRSLELINAGIDGELGADERAELDRLLASSADARAMQAALQKLANVLDGMPELAPPDDLMDRVIRRARLPRQRRPLSLTGLLGSFQPLPAGLAFAAGLLLTVSAYEISLGQRGPSDVSSMVGTMVAGSQDERARQGGRLAVSGPGVGGSVLLEDTGHVVVLSFDVDAKQITEFVIAMADAGLDFGGVAREVSAEAGAAEYYEVSGGELRVVNERSHPFNVYLRRTGTGDGRSRSIGIEVLQSGERVFEGSLAIGGESR
jgi:hypothetical protein